MIYGDFMAFPFPQHELMDGAEDLKIDPNICLDICQATSVPPYMRKTLQIAKEHMRFKGLVSNQRHFMEYDIREPFYGLQHPPLDVGLIDLQNLRSLGIRFMTLAYDKENIFGGGFASDSKGLTVLGRQLIKDMAHTDMILDLSHSNWQTARDAIQFIKTVGLEIKVVITHTACSTIYNHPRCFPDDVLDGVAELGGLIGLVTVSWMLSQDDDSLRPFLAHLTHMIGRVGRDKVCLGTDGAYKHLDDTESRRRFDAIKKKIDPDNLFRARYPEQPSVLNSPERLRVIEEGLKTDGFASSVIGRIMGKNLQRFLELI